MAPFDPAPISIGRLTLVFSWRGDRFGHQVLLAESGALGRPARPLVESLEGAADELWPASPPLQEFHIESRGEGRLVALLIGRAGKSHWSLSVLCDAGREELFFEAACRAAQPPAWLGSRYRIGAGFEPSAGDHPEGHDARERVWAESIGGVWTSSSAAGPRMLLASSDRGQQTELSLAASNSPTPGAQTICWGYRFAVR
jgi:hypothetical protein